MSPGEGMERGLNNAQKSPGHSAPGQTTEIPAHPPSPGRKRLHSGKSPALSPALARDHWIEGGPTPGRQSGSGDSNPGIPRSSLPTPPGLTEAEEAHQQEHHEPVRQVAGVAERGQSARGAPDRAVPLGSVPKQRPRLLIFLLHRPAVRNGVGSKSKAGETALT